MNAPNRFLIDIEGADGSGKATQAKLLAERLEAAGRPVAQFSFPRYYESAAGKLIGELLSGKHGDFMSMAPYVSGLPYALDRAGARDEICAALDAGKIIVSDRYTPSNLAHQSAKLPKDEQDALISFFENLEYTDLKLPRPTRVIYLAVPTDVSSELVTRKDTRGYITDGTARDQAERNIAHQDRTRAVYTKLAAERPEWSIVNCTSESGLRSPEDIHEEVWSIVQADIAR